MRIEHSFTVDAPPDQVFALMIDPHQVVGCVPGAELVELIDAQTFRGRIKIKAGAVQVTYEGLAHVLDVTEHDDTATVTVDADAREVGGQGTVKASLTLAVTGAGEGRSTISLATDFTVTGRIAQFGRGIMQDISSRLVGKMAKAIEARLLGGGAEGAVVGSAGIPPG